MKTLLPSAPPRILLLIGLSLVLGCDTESPTATRSDDAVEVANCTLDPDRLHTAAPKDAIPALTNPPFAEHGGRATRYLADSDRVIGLLFGTPTLAVPLNILWHHEVVNLRRGIITHCPLTGSSLAFDRVALDGAEFGVSGLLLKNNLVMYDRSDDASLWPQMSRTAKCGPRQGRSMPMRPVVEMTWGRWKELYPNTKVVSSNTGYNRDYTAAGYPYFGYDDPTNRDLIQDIPIDDRRPPKERVLGIPNGPDGGIALPFGALNQDAPVRVVRVAVGGSEKTVFWSRDAQAAMAFQTSTSFVVEDERIVDASTGSTWTVDGRAVEGPRKGDRLEPVTSAYVAYWFAWAAFQPDTHLWTPSS